MPTAEKPVIPIVIDTREQDPLSFAELACTVERGTVKVFDYAVRGDDGWAVERKSLPDFVGSITGKKEIQDGEYAKIRKARKVFDAGTPLVYVVETSITGLLPERPCACVHLRASTRCPLCRGKAVSFCECIRDRPSLSCPWCRGSGIVGYNYGRRQIGSPFAYHQLTKLIYPRGVCVLFADTREIAACMIESLLRRRWEWIDARTRVRAERR